MASKAKCRQLAALIETGLKQGIVIGESLIQFIDSTYLNPSDEDLRDIFSDADSCQNASLFDLVFSPDEAFQITLENDLQQMALCPADTPEVVTWVLAKPLDVDLVFPYRNLAITVRMPRENVERFVGLLNIGSRTDPRIVRSIDRFLDAPLNTIVKVAFRNLDKPVTETETLFWCRFIENAPSGFPEFRECLELMMALFSENPGHTDTYRLLETKKRNHLKNLNALSRWESRSRGQNMETLFLKGIRTPYLNAAKTKKQIAHLDTVAYIVYGKIPLSGEMPSPERQEECITIDAIDRMIRYLS